MWVRCAVAVAVGLLLPRAAAEEGGRAAACCTAPALAAFVASRVPGSRRLCPRADMASDMGTLTVRAAQTLAVRVRGLELPRGQPGGHPEHREAGRRRKTVPKRPQVRAREPWHLFERVRGQLPTELARQALTPEHGHVQTNLERVSVVEARVEMRASRRA